MVIHRDADVATFSVLAKKQCVSSTSKSQYTTSTSTSGGSRV